MAVSESKLAPMEVTILGSGTCVIRDRGSASFLLRTGDQSILLDCGCGAPDRLLKARQDIQKLDHIIISHPHADHMGSLMHVMQSMLVAGISISGPGYQNRVRSKPLNLHGYRGFEADYETLRSMQMPERDEKYDIRLFEYYEKFTNTFNDLKITGVYVPHVPQFFNAAAFRIDHNGKSVTYSGDSCYDKRLIDLAMDSDLALFEASVAPSAFRSSGPRPNNAGRDKSGGIWRGNRELQLSKREPNFPKRHP